MFILLISGQGEDHIIYKDEELEPLIEEVLYFVDDNNDGFVDYSEYRIGLYLNKKVRQAKAITVTSPNTAE